VEKFILRVEILAYLMYDSSTSSPLQIFFFNVPHLAQYTSLWIISSLVTLLSTQCSHTVGAGLSPSAEAGVECEVPANDVGGRGAGGRTYEVGSDDALSCE
jgi:hypothetical protein